MMAQTWETHEVLTLEEAAAWLRVAESEVVQLVEDSELPARKIGGQWRILKDSIVDWLRSKPATTLPHAFPHNRIMRHAGAAKDDPHLEEMLEDIYRERGRPMTDEQD